MRWSLMVLVIAAAGCSDRPPDVARSAGDSVDVVTIRHDADAFDSAPQWTIDTSPVVVYNGQSDPHFDLGDSRAPVRLVGGRLVVFGRSGALLLFAADGRPERVLARRGEGPGDLSDPLNIVLLGNDTVAVASGGTGQTRLYTPDAGFVRMLPPPTWPGGSCLALAGVLPDARVVATPTCEFMPPRPDTTGRKPMPILTMHIDATGADTIAIVPGWELVGRTVQGYPVIMQLTFGRRAHVTVWDSLVVTATGEGGYVLDLREPTGEIVRRIVVASPRRPVTQEMRDVIIADLLSSSAHPGEQPLPGSLDAARQAASEHPFADSLPPYSRIIAARPGWLWVVDAQAPGDTSWSAAAFAADGSLQARLHSPRGGMPFWFDQDHVLVREHDDNDVVRFAWYRMSRP
jgi:hypothetical protein